MGKNKLGSKNPMKSGNPIYKKAGQGLPMKAKGKVKPVKMKLKQLKHSNKEAVAALDKQLDTFRQALMTKPKTDAPKPEPKADSTSTETPKASVDETMDAMARL